LPDPFRKGRAGSRGVPRRDVSRPRHGRSSPSPPAIADFAFRELGARRVEIRCDVANVRSAAIPPRIGFVHEATLRNARRHHLSGKLGDTLLFARTAEDPR
jgi:hypothetical protein